MLTMTMTLMILALILRKICQALVKFCTKLRQFLILQAFEATSKAYKFTYDSLVILYCSTACHNVARGSCLRSTLVVRLKRKS